MSRFSGTGSLGEPMSEPTYTLAEAEALLLPKFTRDRCMKGAGAPGHMVKEFIQRNAIGEIAIWGLSCPRCGAEFEAVYRD